MRSAVFFCYALHTWFALVGRGTPPLVAGKAEECGPEAPNKAGEGCVQGVAETLGVYGGNSKLNRTDDIAVIRSLLTKRD